MMVHSRQRKDALASLNSAKISFDQFQQLSTTYDLHDDIKMVEFINKFCDQNGVNRFNLKVLPFQDNTVAVKYSSVVFMLQFVQ